MQSKLLRKKVERWTQKATCKKVGSPVHLDARYAAKTIFKKPIAHGMLTAGYISTVFGMELPGPGAIYVSQTLNFRASVREGDRVVAKVRVVELYPIKRVIGFVLGALWKS